MASCSTNRCQPHSAMASFVKACVCMLMAANSILSEGKHQQSNTPVGMLLQTTLCILAQDITACAGEGREGAQDEQDPGQCGGSPGCH